MSASDEYARDMEILNVLGEGTDPVIDRAMEITGKVFLEDHVYSGSQEAPYSSIKKVIANLLKRDEKKCN